MQLKTRPILVILLAFILTALACNLPLKKYSDNTIPGENIKPTEQVTLPNIQSNDGALSVTITEAQLASMVSQSLQYQSAFQIQDITASIRDGKITLTGNLIQSDLAIPLTISLELSVNQQGNLNYRIVSGELGSLPLSQEILDQFSNQLNQAIDNEVRSATGDMFIESVQITNGLLVLLGRAR